MLNILFGTGMIWASARILQRYGLSDFYALVVLVAMIFLIPLPALILAGMEHALQVFFSILFAYVAATVLSTEHLASRDRRSVFLLALAPFVSAVRYEGLFLVSIVCLLLLLRKLHARALMLGALGILPLVIYGLISVRHGWFAIPNPLLLKSSALGIVRK